MCSTSLPGTPKYRETTVHSSLCPAEPGGSTMTQEGNVFTELHLMWRFNQFVLPDKNIYKWILIDTRDLSACSNYSLVPEGQLVLQKKKHIWMRQETENRRKRRKRKWSRIQWSGRPNQQKPTTAVTSTLGQMIEIMGPDERHQEEDWGIEFSVTRYEDYIQILIKALLHVFIIGR